MDLWLSYLIVIVFSLIFGVVLSFLFWSYLIPKYQKKKIIKHSVHRINEQDYTFVDYNLKEAVNKVTGYKPAFKQEQQEQPKKHKRRLIKMNKNYLFIVVITIMLSLVNSYYFSFAVGVPLTIGLILLVISTYRLTKYLKKNFSLHRK